MGSDNTRVQALTKYNTSTITTDGNTDCFIYGANYFTNFGEFADKSIGETFELSGDRLLEFSADSRKISGEVQFRPIAMKVSCPNLKRLVLYGISTLSGNLDLSGCPKLESADLRGTGINSISFPEHPECIINHSCGLQILGKRVFRESFKPDIINNR